MTYRPGLLTIVAAILVAVLLIIPSLMAVPASLTDMTYLSLPKHALSLQHYARFLEDPDWLHSFALSLGTSITAAVFATLLGSAFAIGAWTLSGRWALLAQGAVLLPLAIPGIIAALALYLLWTQLGWYDTVTGVIVVQMIVGLPFVVILTSAALRTLDRAQVRASRSLGAGTVRTLIRIVLPNIRQAILAGFVLALVTGWDESVITLFITGRDVQVLPRRIWDSLRYDIDPIVAVVATLLFALTVAGVVCFMLLSSRNRMRARTEGGGMPPKQV